ncbi:MAG: hypothetical protein IPP72_05200 [Chitinophagaceae bacterium]|nr:hypothetical protein [Chitinophagaceae bacterium]
MSKAAKVLICYYLLLGICSLIFSWLNIHSYFYLYAGQKMELNPILIPTIIGGIIALKLTVPPRSLKVFLIVYIGLWVLRLILMYAANKIGEAYVFNRVYRFDLIVASYYKTVSRLDTHLPFVLFWFINYLFTVVLKPAETDREKQS